MTEPFLVRLTKDNDLLQELEEMIARRDVTKASLQLIGALQRAVLGYYDQSERKYMPHVVGEPVEVLSGLGNVSLMESSPFVHLHLTLATREGRCVGGHAMEGCVIFAAEVLVTPLPGKDLTRKYDPETGLSLWEKTLSHKR